MGHPVYPRPHVPLCTFTVLIPSPIQVRLCQVRPLPLPRRGRREDQVRAEDRGEHGRLPAADGGGERAVGAQDEVRDCAAGDVIKWIEKNWLLNKLKYFVFTSKGSIRAQQERERRFRRKRLRQVYALLQEGRGDPRRLDQM